MHVNLLETGPYSCHRAKMSHWTSLGPASSKGVLPKRGIWTRAQEEATGCQRQGPRVWPQAWDLQAGEQLQWEGKGRRTLSEGPWVDHSPMVDFGSQNRGECILLLVHPPALTLSVQCRLH